MYRTSGSALRLHDHHFISITTITHSISTKPLLLLHGRVFFQLSKPIVLARCTLESVIARPGRLQLYLHIPALSRHASADPSRRNTKTSDTGSAMTEQPTTGIRAWSTRSAALMIVNFTMLATLTVTSFCALGQPAQSGVFWRTPSTLKVRAQSLSEISSSDGALAIPRLRRKSRAIFNFLSATGEFHDVKLHRHQQLHRCIQKRIISLVSRAETLPPSSTLTYVIHHDAASSSQHTAPVMRVQHSKPNRDQHHLVGRDALPILSKSSTHEEPITLVAGSHSYIRSRVNIVNVSSWHTYVSTS